MKIQYLIITLLIISFSFVNASVVYGDGEGKSLFRSEQDVYCGSTCWEDYSCTKNECNTLDGCEFHNYECIESGTYEHTLENGEFCYNHKQCKSGYCSQEATVSFLTLTCCPEGSDWDYNEKACIDNGEIVATGDEWIEKNSEELKNPISNCLFEFYFNNNYRYK